MAAQQKKSSSIVSGNLTGPPRVVNDILVTFYNTIQKWNEQYLNGVQVFKDVQNDGDEDKFQNFCEKLGILVEFMHNQVIVLQECSKKLLSLSQLYPGNNPVFLSWRHQDFGNCNQ